MRRSVTLLLRAAPLLLLAALLFVCTCLFCAGPAVAANASWLTVQDVGPAVVLGSGGGTYPADLTLKLIPYEYNEPIPTEDFGEMLKGVGKYVVANAGVDILFGSLTSFEHVEYGVSLPVVNDIGSIPLRLGGCYLQEVGPRMFVRLDASQLVGGGGSGSAGEITALAALRSESLDLMDQLEFGLPAAPLIPQVKQSTLGLAWAGSAVLVRYTTGF